MPRSFSKSTAELVVQVVAAVQASGSANCDMVQAFCDLAAAQAVDALALACDLGLLRQVGLQYESATHLTQFINTPDELKRAALLRIVLESYEPFLTFRQRLVATNSVDTAARETKALLGLTSHREEVKDTLISLGTYTGAIVGLGGGQYDMGRTDVVDPVQIVAQVANDLATSEQLIRARTGIRSDRLDRVEVIRPLAEALLKAKVCDARGAVADAARAIESFLVALAARVAVSLTGANGITQKLDKFRAGNQLPKKLVEAGRYLGQIRNAADHGIDVDPDVDALWSITDDTGMLYVLVACAFIASCLEREANAGFSF